MSKCIVQTLLDHQQAWSHDHFLGQLFTVLDHPLSEELASNIQPELALMF